MLESSVLTLLLITVVTMCSIMFLVWLVSERIHNAGIVDVAWGFGFVIVAMIDFLFAQTQNWGWTERSLAVLLMVACWSLRLGIFLALRFKRMWPHEDGRYSSYRQAWGKNGSVGLLLAFEMQALLLSALTLPIALAVTNTAENFNGFEIVGIIIFITAFAGESAADHQLETFKKDPGNKGKVCQTGLWNYSRHPNYFFEWLVWLAFFIFSLANPAGWITFYCPLLMLWFLLKVTGIKATEEQALRSKGDLYAKYQRTTSPFVPWFKRADREKV